MSENTEDDNLGEARIEAAYGSGDGDEDISATVASAPQGQILEQVYRVLYEDKTPIAALDDLMRRDLKRETD